MVLLKEQGYSMFEIIKHLNEEGIIVSWQSLYKLLNKFHTSSRLTDLPKRTSNIKITPEMIDAIDEALQQNDELTARQLHALLL